MEQPTNSVSQTPPAPPLISEMQKYRKTYECSWVIPGHQGGAGFKKTAAGQAFYDFYGHNLFNSDLNSARAPLGSLLRHSGAFRRSETNIARIFGSDMSYSGVVGSSGSNRSVMQFCVTDGATVAVDRNCHKSVTQGLILTGAQPVYMKPSRNAYGIIGPVSVREIRRAMAHRPVYGVFTNCTFDGVCYNAVRVEREMRDIPYLHFDEAWFAYARFSQLYNNMYAMRGHPADDADRRPATTVFVTHSTHKMLNALSQASYIHIRNGSRRPVDAAKFNQAYMMHTTTSPLYPIAASNDIAAHMMDGEAGNALMRQVVNEAVAFRQRLARLHTQITATGRNDWFFRPWNVAKYGDVLFEELPADELATDQKYWMMRPGDTWHGFADLQDADWAMLDPIKVNVITPGLDEGGEFVDNGVGVPAALVNAWLVHNGIVAARHGDFQLMFLFTMGTTKQKSATLLRGLHSFKRHYDANEPIKRLLPELCEIHDAYGAMGLRDLADKMFAFLRHGATNLCKLLNDAYDTLPEVAMSPREGYRTLIVNSEPVKIEDLANRVTVSAIFLYPPGIPMMMSGERFGANRETCPHIKYLSAVEKWDKEFPGFRRETTGVEIDADGNYHILCAVEKN